MFAKKYLGLFMVMMILLIAVTLPVFAENPIN